MRFAVDLTAILQVHHYALANPYDVAAYAHSGYPSVASYILSEALAGGILGGLVLYPSPCSSSRSWAPRRAPASGS